MQSEGSLQQLFQFCCLSHGCQLLEKLLHIFANLGITGEEPVVRIQPRGALVVVTGAQMDIAAQTAAFPPYHHAHFAVGFVAYHTVHNLCTNALQVVCELNVGFLIESSAQFDDHKHLFTAGCRICESFDHSRFRSGPIERLTNGQYLRIGRSLPEKIEEGCKRFEGMMQEYVPFANRLEYVTCRAQTFRNTRREARILQFGPVDEFGHRCQPHEIHRTVAAINAVR